MRGIGSPVGVNWDLQGFQPLKQAINFRPHPMTVAQSPYQSGNHQTAILTVLVN
jgi:hypothetical protein